MPVPPNHRDGLALPRMAQMGEDHPQFGKTPRHRIEMNRPRILGHGSANERSARMKKHRQPAPFAVAVDLAAAWVQGMDALIERRQLPPDRAEIGVTAFKFLHETRRPRVN